MTAVKRINSFISGIFKMFSAIILVLWPEEAVDIITAILAVSLLFYGIKMFVYYFTLARHMTGGLTVLYRAAVVFDIGLFAVKMPELPLVYVMIYLAALHGFSGIAAILKALESKRLEAPSWKLNFTSGIINVFMAVLCLLFFRSISIAVDIYCAGLFYAGIINVVQSMRKTASIYVQ